MRRAAPVGYSFSLLCLFGVPRPLNMVSLELQDQKNDDVVGDGGDVAFIEP